ncbi:hypothetical protein ABT154_08890 [Streptomyces sp. NPDC001728]|uniref:hypothetical protein n=1 Tax=Streptomyces sp. NPDC001728 TaxID=3154396 RepID=UPI00332C1D81
MKGRGTGGAGFFGSTIGSWFLGGAAEFLGRWPGMVFEQGVVGWPVLCERGDAFLTRREGAGA